MKFLGKNENVNAGSFYLIGNLFNKAIAFITIPIFTRILSPEDYGIVNTYLSWVSILTVIVGLALSTSIRNAYVDFKDDLNGYIASTLFLSLLNFIGIFILILIIWYYFFNQIDIAIVILCLIQSFMTYVMDSITLKYMMSLEYVKRTLLLAIPNVVIAILSIIVIINLDNYKYYGRIIPYVAVNAIIGVNYLISTFMKGKKFVDKKYWKYATALSLPLIFHGLSINILTSSDRIMIAQFRSTSEAGVYSLTYSFSMIAIVVISSLESVWIPWFTQKLKCEYKEVINRNVRIYIEIVTVLVLCILFVAPEILVIMAPEEYWSGKVLIPPVILASFIVFLYSIAVNVEYYYKSTKIIALNTIIAAFVNLGLNFIFIPMYGAIAAAYTTVVAYFISFVIHFCAARKLDNELFPLRVYLNPLILVVFGVISMYLFMEYPLIRWIIAIVGFAVYTIMGLKNNKLSDLLKKERL